MINYNNMEPVSIKRRRTELDYCHESPNLEPSLPQPINNGFIKIEPLFTEVKNTEEDLVIKLEPQSIGYGENEIASSVLDNTNDRIFQTEFDDEIYGISEDLNIRKDDVTQSTEDIQIKVEEPEMFHDMYILNQHGETAAPNVDINEQSVDFIEQSNDLDSVKHSKRYMCSVCFRLFSKEKELRSHIKKIHYIHCCVGCGNKFHTRVKMQTHSKTCGSLSNSKTGKQTDMSHSKRRRAGQPFILNVHFTCKYRDTIPTYECMMCADKFSERHDLNSHIYNLHFPYSCTICGEIFNKERALIEHSRSCTFIMCCKNKPEHLNEKMTGNSAIVKGNMSDSSSNYVKYTTLSVGVQNTNTNLISTRNTNPTTGNSNPVTGDSNLVMRDSNPVKGNCNPVTKNSNPATGNANPVTGNSNPVTGSANPVSIQNRNTKPTLTQTLNTKSVKIHKLHTCFRCGVEFQTRVKMQTHSKTCRSLSNSKTGKQTDMSHSKRRRAGQPFILNVHFTCKYRDTIPTYGCMMCDEKFSERHDLNSHIYNLHYPYSCTICGEIFNKEGALIEHSRSCTFIMCRKNKPEHLNEKTENPAIVKGNMSASSNPITGNLNPITGNLNPITGNSNPITRKSNPVTENSNLVTGNSNPVTENANSSTGNSNPVLTGHANPVTGNSNPVTGNANSVSIQNRNTKPTLNTKSVKIHNLHCCVGCGKQFHARGNLKTHSKTCGSLSNSKTVKQTDMSNYKRRRGCRPFILNVHFTCRYRDAIPTYVCMMCDEKFSQRRDLNSHIYNLHFPYSCTICGEIFNKERALIEHSRSCTFIMCRKNKPEHLNEKTENPAIVKGNMSASSNPITGNSNPTTGNSNPVTGNSNPVTGNSNPVTGNSNTVTENANSAKGNSNPVLTGNANPVSIQNRNTKPTLTQTLNTKSVKIHKLHTCFRCGVKFQTRVKMQTHSKTCRSLSNFKTGKQTDMSHSKRRRAGQPFILNVHFTCQYRDSIPTYECMMCDEKFSERHDLNSHIYNLHFPYSCTICGEIFNKERPLIEHSRSCTFVMCRKNKPEHLNQKMTGNSAIVKGNMSASSSNPITGNLNPISGNLNPITGNSNPITGNSNPVTRNSNPATGNANRVTGNSNPVTGNSNPVTGNSNPVTGNSNPVLTKLISRNVKRKSSNRKRKSSINRKPTLTKNLNTKSVSMQYLSTNKRRRKVSAYDSLVENVHFVNVLVEGLSCYMCTKCNEQFGRKCDMNVHIVTHFPYSCSICGKMFPEKKDYFEHSRNCSYVRL